MTDALPTSRIMLRADYVRMALSCRSCLRQQDADLQALVDAGRGDVPLVHLRWRSAHCGHRKIDFVVTSRDVARPW